METFTMHFFTADHPVYEGQCLSLTVPIWDGLYGILAHHSNMIATVIPGMMTVHLPEQEPMTLAVSDGLVKVEDNEVLLLVKSAERPEDIDLHRSELRAAQAQEEKANIQEHRLAEATLARAMNRLRVRRHYDGLE
ncbi:MAG: F0F1 ATP synthase subunit epsilon [Clostridiales bacterium]|nr:F0F1 ATP synthase subunit epsilon [Clostridiales bacterium]